MADFRASKCAHRRERAKEADKLLFLKAGNVSEE
jgi:hypothetical protein